MAKSILTIENLHPDAMDDQPWARKKPYRDEVTGKRVNGETEQAWNAFVFYRDMPWKEEGARHRLKKHVAAEFDINIVQVTGWARKWDWDSRAAAFDNFMDQQAVAKLVVHARGMRAKQVKIGAMLQAKAVKVLMQYPESEITPSVALSMITAGSNLERLALGESTENVKSSGTVIHKYIEVKEQKRDKTEFQMYLDAETESKIPE